MSTDRSITVEEYGQRGTLRGLGPAWESLAERAGAGGPFMQPEWLAVQAAWLARAPGSLRLLVAHRRGELVGALPLLVERRRIGGVPARVLRSLSDDHAQRFVPLATEPAAVTAMVEHLIERRGWDAIELRDVPEESPVDAWLVAAAERSGMRTGTWPSLRSPHMPLPATAQALDASLAAKFRANLKRRARRLSEELGPITLEPIDSRGPGAGARIDAALDAGWALEASGWKGRAGTAIALDPKLRGRYRALARAFAGRGELALSFLRAGERRVAFHFAVETGGTYYLFKPGLDESLSRFGPGHLHLYEVARALIGRGASAIDFLGDDMEWKRSWTTAVRAHHFRYLMRPGVFGGALWAWKFHGLPRARALAEQVGAARRGEAPPERAVEEDQ